MIGKRGLGCNVGVWLGEKTAERRGSEESHIHLVTSYTHTTDIPQTKKQKQKTKQKTKTKKKINKKNARETSNLDILWFFE